MAKILNITKNLILKSLNAAVGVEKRDKLIGFYARLKKPDLYERLECYGELNTDKTIYLIRRCGGAEKGCSQFLYMLWEELIMQTETGLSHLLMWMKQNRDLCLTNIFD